MQMPFASFLSAFLCVVIFSWLLMCTSHNTVKYQDTSQTQWNILCFITPGFPINVMKHSVNNDRNKVPLHTLQHAVTILSFKMNKNGTVCYT